METKKPSQAPDLGNGLGLQGTKLPRNNARHFAAARLLDRRPSVPSICPRASSEQGCCFFVAFFSRSREQYRNRFRLFRFMSLFEAR